MIQNLINLILENPNDINIQYTNINGKEELFINGQKIKAKSEAPIFDDTEIKTDVNNFKETLKKVDDNLFVVFCEELSKVLDINEFNKLLDLKSFNEEEAEEVECLMCQSINVLCELIESRLNYLNELKEMLLK